MLRRSREDLKDTIDVARQMYRECRRVEGQGKAISFPEWCRLSHGVSGERCRCHELSGLVPHTGLCGGTDAVPEFCGYLQAIRDIANDVGARCQFRATCNPGGPGPSLGQELDHRQRRVPPGQGSAETGLIRIFIPAKISDNPSLLNNDPGLHQPPAGLGLPRPRQAWLEGDWNVIEGAFFPEFDPDRHVITPPRIPLHWTRFRSHGLGQRHPLLHSAGGWWCRKI